MTPEGQIKKLVKDYLISIGLIPAGQAVLCTKDHTGWFYMPVSNGMGVHGIPDFLGHYKGRFFAIETKTKGKKPTPRQEHQLGALALTGAKVFVVDSEDSLEGVKKWVSQMHN